MDYKEGDNPGKGGAKLCSAINLIPNIFGKLNGNWHQEDLGCLNPVFGSLWLSYDHIGKLSVLCIFCCNGFLLDHGAV